MIFCVDGARKESVQYPINYEKVEELLNIEGLKTDKDEASTPEAHALFIKKIKEIFIKPGKGQLPSVEPHSRYVLFANTVLDFSPTG